MPTGMAFTPDGAAVVVVSDASLVTATVATGQVVVKKPQDKPHYKAVYQPALKRVVEVRQKEDFSGPELAMWDPASDGAPTKLSLAGSAQVASFAVSGDGKLLAVCSSPINDNEKGRVTFYSTNDGKTLGQLPADDAPRFSQYRELTLSPDGKYLAGVGTGGLTGPFYSMDLYRVADAKRIYRTTANSIESGTFASFPRFSLDGKWVYYILNDSKFMRIDIEKGTQAPYAG
jgi:hypothetical protein